MENSEKPVFIERVMEDSYIAYAMSVIVARALPDVRDGLKPVHRRILYAMNELNLDYNKPYKKSARIVGDTMGKYHPHGNTAIYDAMVRMAQEFSMRYMLVDGHGNFGSVDGDAPAAERYTEARLSRLAAYMLSDIEKDTVDFAPNYTEEFKEPTVLPSRAPNLLINGSSGIAVGMATNIPPHNLAEITEAVITMIDNFKENKETDIEDLIKIVSGPDFPTAGFIVGREGIRDAYRTGRGKIIMRAKAEIETNGHKSIVVTELPYQVNKAVLLKRIAELVKDKKISGISDLREESDRNGLRFVVEVRKDANPNVVLNKLYKFSQMQESFGVNMIALVDNEPKTLNLKELLHYYILHQKDVVVRRTRFELAKAKKREHILDGYVIALSNIDEVIEIIKKSSDTASAKANLRERFGFTEEQVTAIVELPLRSLTNLEQEKIQEELAKLKKIIAELTEILNNENVLYDVIKKELLEIKDKFADPRRTIIINDADDIEIEDLIQDETNVITMTDMDYIKRAPLDSYKSQNRGGKGVRAIKPREEDIVSNMFITNSKSDVMFFTNRGRVYIIKAYEIPEAGKTARGTAIVNLLNLGPGEKIAAAFPINISETTENCRLLMFTKKGIVKRINLSQFSNINKRGIIALNIHDGDELIKVLLSDGGAEVFLATSGGMCIRFSEDDARPVGRSAAGVKAVKLRKDDFVIGAGLINDEDVIFVSENGFGNRVAPSEFKLQSRAGIGLIGYRVSAKTGAVVSLNFAKADEELILITSEGITIRINVSEIPQHHRSATGVKLIKVEDDVKVISSAKISQAAVALGNGAEETEQG